LFLGHTDDIYALYETGYGRGIGRDVRRFGGNIELSIFR